MTEFIPASTLTCPECGHVKTETMPTDACQFFYDCEGCKAVLKPLSGDCCVFCSYGDVACPPVQINGRCGDRPPQAGNG
ncbi:MAG: hypothetical protein IIC08_06290 [Proteobacteria bacterium]|nr:hypothetical protein [Pseudomonadota bacterium]